MTITFAPAWCPESGRPCSAVLGARAKARCPECGRWLRPRVDALDDAVLPHHLPVKPRRGR